MILVFSIFCLQMRLHAIHPKAAYRQALKLKRKEFQLETKPAIKVTNEPTKTHQMPTLKTHKVPKIQLLKKDIKINTNHINSVNQYRMDQISHLFTKSQDFITFDNLEQKIEECMKFVSKPKVIKMERSSILKDIMLK